MCGLTEIERQEFHIERDEYMKISKEEQNRIEQEHNNYGIADYDNICNKEKT